MSAEAVRAITSITLLAAAVLAWPVVRRFKANGAVALVAVAYFTGYLNALTWSW